MKFNRAVSLVAIASIFASATAEEQKCELTYTDADSIMLRTAPRPIDSARRDTTLNLWRGERGGFAAMFRSSVPTGRLRVSIETADTMLGKAATPMFLDYVASNSHKGCGWPADTLPVIEVADALTTPLSAPVAAGTRRPLWVTVDIPADAAPGVHTGKIVIEDIWKGTRLDSADFSVDVSGRQLPAPTEWKFDLNIWQQPFAVSRYYGVENWSDEHFRKLDPYIRLLARGGQKTVSTILFYEPWGDQSNDKFEPMVETTRNADGSWSYDYSVFDRWVDYMASHGIDQEIECFSMIPWDMNFRYINAADGGYETLHTTADSPEYEALWTAFLKSFAKHLKEKGWFDRTVIAIDERSLPDMQRAREIASKAAPGLKLALHGAYHPELDDLDSYTLLVGDLFPEEVLKRRNAEGKVSRYYTCCANAEPNIFTNSDPADAAYIPVYCTANDVSGYLHWAFFNWTDMPDNDSRFFMFAPGDTYCVYPGGGSSLRWERMIEGIELSEKITLLRDEFKKRNDKVALERLDAALAPMRGIPASFSDRLRHYDALRATVASLSKD